MFWRLGWAEPTMVKLGQEALTILKTQCPIFDVIILDQGLPIMKGLDFLAAAKKLKYHLPPVIMITGDYDSTVEPRAKELGVASFFMKNKLSESKLKEVLAEVLDNDTEP
jgi:CheY-like chemotaxis protein